MFVIDEVRVAGAGVLAGGQGEEQLQEVAANCYYVNQGWWSYELCPGHHLGQFHASEETKGIESALSLGRYDAVQVLPSPVLIYHHPSAFCVTYGPSL